jgi:anti-sigma-K factor RskA
VNIKEYIASGIVESYVLGLASEQERAELEQLCAHYPELVEARTNFELMVEKQAIENAVAPPATSKSKIWSNIQTRESNTPTLITMEPAKTPQSFRVGWLAAASIILMLVAGYFAYSFYKKNNDLKASNDEMVARLNRMDSVINEMKKDQAVVQNPNTTVINMSALKQGNNPPAASVYWDSTSANVYLLIKNMPRLASDKQYQLWSLLNGKPTSLGLFDGGEEKLMLRMEKAQKADAFAITIETRGNTGPPHLEDLQTMGKTKL